MSIGNAICPTCGIPCAEHNYRSKVVTPPPSAAIERAVDGSHGVETVPKKPKRAKKLSRRDRWDAAVSQINTVKEELQNALDELKELQSEYQEWRDNLPENLGGTALAEKLDAVCDLDLDLQIDVLDEIESIELPLGFGRD